MKWDCRGPWVPGEGNCNSIVQLLGGKCSRSVWDALIQLTYWKAKVERRKRENIHRDRGNSVRNTTTKTCKLICNKNVSSLPLEIWAVLGDRNVACFLSYTHWRSFQYLSHYGRVGLHWRWPIPWCSVGMISDFCAFPALCPSLLPLRLSDTGSVAEGGAMGGMLPKAVHWLLH